MYDSDYQCCWLMLQVLMAKHAGYEFVIIYNPISNDLKEMDGGKCKLLDNEL
jgi:hypothetical protein